MSELKLDEHGILHWPDDPEMGSDVDDHRGRNWCPRHRNGYYMQEKALTQALARAKRVVDLLTPYVEKVTIAEDGAEVLPKDAWDMVREVYPIADNLEMHLPRIECWCVVKHYHDHDKRTGLWAPKVWTGHKTKRQAEAFAKAIYKHYDSKYHGRPDDFKVEWRDADLGDLISPTHTATDYVASIG